ncbi:MAG: EAL domain-containing protein [Pseudomonadales bacterium]|nr:EAL domain-containing protein [Pseudomonadales bacterium]
MMMASPTHKKNRRFLSLKWKTLILFSTVLLSINLCLLFFGYRYIQASLELQLSHATEQNMSALLQQAKKNLLRLTSTLALTANKNFDIGLQENILIEFMDNNWENLQFDLGLESISLHHTDSDEILHWGGFIKNADLNYLVKDVDQASSPKTLISCQQQCRIYAAQPIFMADNSSRVLVISTTLDGFIVQFSQDYDIGIALLRDRIPSLEKKTLRIWDYFLAGVTSENDYQQQLLALSKSISFDDFLTQGRHLKIEDKYIYFYAIPVKDDIKRSSNFMILMTDITEQENSISNNLMVAVITFCLGLLLALVSLFLVLRQPMQRIILQAELLPLLAKSGFKQVRQTIGDQHKVKATYDELDIFEETAIALSYQLEQMETEIGSRTDELENMALYDVLTGLANRRKFTDDLAMALADAQLNHTIFAIVFIDLDNFKWVNDSLGHDVGDELLISVAKCLRHNVRPSDTVARLGGDEFTLILNNIGNQVNIVTVMDKILQSFKKSIYLVNNSAMAVTPSMGIAIGPKQADNVTDLMRCADIAMYSAKQEGKNRYHFFDQDMHEKIQKSLLLEKEINLAIQEKQFRLYYQPIIDLKTGKVVMMEALLRWIHPEKGLLAPFEFIDMLEESGKIVELGPQLFEMACLSLKLLQACGLEHIRIAINISAKQFKDANLVNKLLAVMDKNGIKAEKLELEITENTLMEDLDQQCLLLQKLQKIGFDLAIDDFGTGYSSLSYLKELPVNVLKIDRSFIKDTPQNQQDVAITSAIAAMAHKLNLEVVAEGIETVDQQIFLQGIECKYGQGYLYKRPEALETIIGFLKDNAENPAALLPSRKNKV